MGYIQYIKWPDDKNGKVLAYFDKNIQSIKGDKKLKKGTKEEVLGRLSTSASLWVRTRDIKKVLNSLEEYGYIKFKKEPKEYKVFFKLVTIGEEKKKLYYMNDFHLTENIDEAERFGLDEYINGYASENVKEY